MALLHFYNTVLNIGNTAKKTQFKPLIKSTFLDACVESLYNKNAQLCLPYRKGVFSLSLKMT